MRNVTFMTADPGRLADFWSEALDLRERRDEENETIVADGEWGYPRLTFQKVSEPSDRAARVHLDLTADDREAEVNRLVGTGAQEVRHVALADGWTWTVMTDPDGNEFCVTDP